MKIILLILVAICTAIPSFSQSFDIEAYKEYLRTHVDMTAEELLEEYPAGNFERYAKTDLHAAEFGDSIAQKYRLTPYEEQLIADHGFMVTERLATNSYQKAFYDIYHKDLPVYISADAILHALHYSFDSVLKVIEIYHLLGKLDTVLTQMHEYILILEKEYSNSFYKKAIYDLDVYLTIALSPLKYNYEPKFDESKAKVSEIKNLISRKSNESLFLFTDSTERDYDFSQFKPRGHYTKSSQLRSYFKAMMWLGRTEIFITQPTAWDKYGFEKNYTQKDIQRQNILAALLVQAADKSGVMQDIYDINEILKSLAGRQDNINIFEVDSVMKVMNIKYAGQLLDTNLCNEFRENLLNLKSANQVYNSQILYSHPNPDSLQQLVPPAAFLLFGQRPIIDGFITANVVFDKIIYKERKVLRMLPKTQDVLFALGNDASAQLLEEELELYPYAANLASVRYLIESYDDEFWNETGYSIWLNAIRTLNPPKDRSHLPKFMQTAAWWQKTMTTQLASWAELRHDFLLYVKQPYTAGYPICSFPYSYVEPIPEFYQSIINFSDNLKRTLNKFESNDRLGPIIEYLDGLKSTCETLKGIAQKELNNDELSKDELDFLKFIISRKSVKPYCVEYYELDGWYMKLYYGLVCDMYKNGVDCGELEPDLLVADVHTAPTDEEGNPTGWVLHAGTGLINMAVIVLDDPKDGCTRAYVGPVSSYYEYLSTNFKRLTDEEWKSMYKNAEQPLFANLYMADEEGQNKGEYEILHNIIISSVDDLVIKSGIKSANYPNPFSNSTIIAFSIPPSKGTQYVELNIYDFNGNYITTLLNESIPPGNYSTRWDCSNSNGLEVSVGTYVYKLRVGDEILTGKMSYVK